LLTAALVGEQLGGGELLLEFPTCPRRLEGKGGVVAVAAI
jgi:hypothetical protein